MTPPLPQHSDAEGQVWPPVLLGNNAALAALMLQIEQTQWLAPEELAQNQARQLQALCAWHQEHTPSFAQRLADAGLRELDSLERLRQLPPMPRREATRLGERLFAQQVPAAHLPLSTVQTSGSTGDPVSVRKTAVSRLFWSAYTLRDHLWHGRRFGERMSAIRSSVHRYVETKNWGPPAAQLFHTGAGQGIPAQTDLREQWRLLRQFGPEVLIVYPGNLAGLADLWESEGFGPTPLRHIRTIGETVRPALRERIRAITGLVIEDHYSTEEAGVIAIQCPVSGLYHLMSEALVAEVVDEQGAPCREGQTGRVLVTDLTNLATPLVRYDLGDYAEPGPRCPCGRGLPTLRRIWGRERNLLRRPDGARYWPATDHDYHSVAPVRQYQLIQTALDHIELKVVTEAAISQEQEAGLAAIVQRALGYPFRVTVTQSRERLRPGANGKFEVFVCQVP
jgi:phenylacetate-CoA ligase